MKELHVQFCLHLEFEIFMEGSHFRLAHEHTEFPVEASHPPPPIRSKFYLGSEVGTGWLFSFQRALDSSFFFARSYAMTFVLFFLTARDSYQKLQFSTIIIHF